MGSTLTQRNTTVSLCLTFLAFNALICTMYGAPMASCGWSLNTFAPPHTNTQYYLPQNTCHPKCGKPYNGTQSKWTAMLDKHATDFSREGWPKPPLPPLLWNGRTAEHELNNFAVKQRLEADILILQNTTTLLGHAEQYDRNHNNKISEGIRNAREQLEDIRRGLTEMVFTTEGGVPEVSTTSGPWNHLPTERSLESLTTERSLESLKTERSLESLTTERSLESLTTERSLEYLMTERSFGHILEEELRCSFLLERMMPHMDMDDSRLGLERKGQKMARRPSADGRGDKYLELRTCVLARQGHESEALWLLQLEQWKDRLQELGFSAAASREVLLAHVPMVTSINASSED
eukprot:Em0018g204a